MVTTSYYQLQDVILPRTASTGVCKDGPDFLPCSSSRMHHSTNAEDPAFSSLSMQAARACNSAFAELSSKQAEQEGSHFTLQI